MKLHASFLLLGVSLAAAQSFLWSFESPKPSLTRNDESQPPVNSFAGVHPLLRHLPQVDDGRRVNQPIRSRGRSNPQFRDGEAGRFFIPNIFPTVQNTVIAPVVSITTVTSSYTCVTYDNFIRNPAYTTPCGTANIGKRKKRDALSDEELIEPSKIEPLEPTAPSSVERPTRNVQIWSSHDDEEPLYRNPRFFVTTTIYSQSTLYFTQTNYVTVSLAALAGPGGVGYLTCLPKGYSVCPN